MSLYDLPPEITAKGQPFWYPVPVFSSIAAAATSSNNIQFDADSRFTWTHTSYMVDLAGAAITDSALIIPLVTVTLTDTGCGRNLMSSAIPLSILASQRANNAYQIPLYRTFSPNATLRCTIANYSAATTYTNLFIVLHGIKNYL